MRTFTAMTVMAAAGVLLAGCGQRDEAAKAPERPGAGAQTAGIWAAGSSTVFPFASRAAENFARKNPGMGTPRIESLGTGGGIKAFCSGPGPGSPDVANASRQMKASEFDNCQKNGVTEIVEVKIGYDGIVIANAKAGATYDLTLTDIYKGLAKEFPAGTPNPARTWADVRAGLPADRIQVYGPPPTSGTRDAFVELALTAGAETIPALKALKDTDEDRFETLAQTVREDGAWIDSGENDNAIVQTLTRTPGSLGVFGYSFLEQNQQTVKGAKVNGVAPTVATIADGSYPVSRSLYLYVKKARVGVTPGLREFLQEFTSDAASARGGYLQDRGLIPLVAPEHAATKAAVAAMTPMTRPAS